MTPRLASFVSLGSLLLLIPHCASADPMKTPITPADALERVKQKIAPDPHLVVFDVAVREDGSTCILTGEADSADAKRQAIDAVADLGRSVKDEIIILPAADLGEKVWGISSISLLNVREKPGNASEMGTQIPMGNAFKILKKETNWFLVQSADQYLGWTEGSGFFKGSEAEVKAWNESPLLIVTSLEDRILEAPSAAALPISDVILCDLVKRVGETNDWYQVALPDGRSGYLPKQAATHFSLWRQQRRPTADNVERDAKSFLGRPYFWGCNSPRGMDCSGFTKLVFYLNGVDLRRNAAQQALQGAEIPIDADCSSLKKGDLLFFGHPATNDAPEKVNHVGIYLGDKLFIHASGMVHISSLDPDSPLHDDRRIRALLHARRLLPN
jgi:hypothetical protein